MNFKNTNQIEKLVMLVLGLLALMIFFIALYFGKLLIKGRGQDEQPSSIAVTATGEVRAIPNIATFTFAVVQEGKDVNEAQSKMASKINEATNFIKSKGIMDKDIQTTNYSANPKFNYTQDKGQTLTSFEARENITVRVRDLSKVKPEDLITGVGSIGATEISQLTLESEDIDELKNQATADAAKKAREKAERLSNEVGFRLGKVISFYEEADGSQQIPYGSTGFTDSKAISQSALVSPIISRGENKINSTVTITYEIK